MDSHPCRPGSTPKRKRVNQPYHQLPKKSKPSDKVINCPLPKSSDNPWMILPPTEQITYLLLNHPPNTRFRVPIALLYEYYGDLVGAVNEEEFYKLKSSRNWMSEDGFDIIYNKKEKASPKQEGRKKPKKIESVNLNQCMPFFN